MPFSYGGIKMRLYTFTNFYMSDIQKGIQTQHACADLFVKYQRESKCKTVLYDWAKNHKTTIVLNGGNAQSLHDLYLRLLPLCDYLDYPICKFHEDQQSLNGCLTCVAIVVPESTYNAEMVISDALRDGENNDIIELCDIISQYRLA